MAEPEMVQYWDGNNGPFETEVPAKNVDDFKENHEIKDTPVEEPVEETPPADTPETDPAEDVTPDNPVI